jgi:hypothetical protein
MLRIKTISCNYFQGLKTDRDNFNENKKRTKRGEGATINETIINFLKEV